MNIRMYRIAKGSQLVRSKQQMPEKRQEDLKSFHVRVCQRLVEWLKRQSACLAGIQNNLKCCLLTLYLHSCIQKLKYLQKEFGGELQIL
jgi:hypothetical protein